MHPKLNKRSADARISDPGRLHHYMGCVSIIYVRKSPEGIEEPKATSMNVVMTSTTKAITYSTLNELRKAAIMRGMEELELEPGSVKNVVFNNIFYLGLMSTQEFRDVKDIPPEQS